MHKVTPWLWFESEAEDAAKFYSATFDNAKITDTTHYGAAGPLPEGTVMTVSFEIDGQPLVALNGGRADFAFNESTSFMVSCTSQEEVDRYWAALTDGGQEGPCGWLKDRYGLSWQIVPTRLESLLRDPDPGRAQRAMAAMLQMTKLEIDVIERAADGTAS